MKKERCTANINMRIPASLHNTVKAQAQTKGLSMSEYIKLLIKIDVAKSQMVVKK